MGGQEANQPAYEAAGELLRALAAPTRIAIVTELAAGQRCVHELVDALGVAQPLVSQHLRVLRGAGVVRGARRGREIAYSLVDEHVAHIVGDAISHAGELRPATPRPGAAPSGPLEPAGGHRPATAATARSRTIDAAGPDRGPDSARAAGGPPVGRARTTTPGR